jgi:hypothetical protein
MTTNCATEGAPPSVFLRVYLPWQVGLVRWNKEILNHAAPFQIFDLTLVT